MKRKPALLPSLLVFLSFSLSACIGLLPIEDKPVAGEFGSAYTPRERQTHTFEALWMHFQDNYIYYESADKDLEAIHIKYQERIDAGLTNGEFVALLHELETDLPAGGMVYQSRAERIEGDVADTSTYEGIGAFIGFTEEPFPHIFLLSVIEGSPAEQAGLRAHDSILKIDGQPIQLEEGVSAVNRIRGPAGSSVTLHVQTPGKPGRSIELQRAKLTSTGKLESEIIKGTNLGYMLFPPITYNALMDDVRQSLQGFTTNRKLEGLIVDLRIAGSARGWPIEPLLSLFHNGVVGEFYNRSGKETLRVSGEDAFSSQTLPLTILVGQNTSGFPEIFAASLQAGSRATLVGSTTPGAIETTSSFYLPDGSRVFIESASFRLPNGEEIGSGGVKPTVQVEAGWDEVLPNADPVLNTAISLLLGGQK